jgi:N4-gp56 family major capsid protein
MSYNSYTAGRQDNSNDISTGINTKEWYNRNLLENAREKFIVSNFTAKKSQPKFEGNTAIFSYYENIPPFDTALAEGETPPGSTLAKINVRASQGTYGAFVPFTDDLDIYGEDGANFKSDVTSNLGGAAGETQELLLLKAAIGSNTDIVFDTDLSQTLNTAELALRNALAVKFTSMITGSTKYSTTTVRPAYVGIVDPDGALLLESLAGWKPVEDYGYSDGLLPNEVGSRRGVRYCETTLMPKEDATDKLQCLIFGEEVLAEVGIRGKKKIETIIQDLGQGGNDQLNREGSIGSKFRLAPAVLRPDQMMLVHLEA